MDIKLKCGITRVGDYKAIGKVLVIEGERKLELSSRRLPILAARQWVQQVKQMFDESVVA